MRLFLDSTLSLIHPDYLLVEFASDSIGWLWEQQDEQGYWDFGPKPDSVSNLPLSSIWKNRKNRLFDWTTRILALLRKYLNQI